MRALAVMFGAALLSTPALADGPPSLAAATAAVRQAAAQVRLPERRSLPGTAAPSWNVAPLLATATSAASILVTPPAAVARAVSAAVELTQNLSAPMTVAGWSTASAAVTQVGAVRIQWQETLLRQAPLACPNNMVAFSFEGHERPLMREADFAGAPNPLK